MSIDSELKAASKAFLAHINSPEVNMIVDAYSGMGDWLFGDCLALAYAVRKWLGGGRAVGIIDGNEELQHILVEKDDLFIDGNGISTRKQVAAYWRRELDRGAGFHRIDRVMSPLVRRRLSLDVGSRGWRRDRARGARGFVDALARSLSAAFPVSSRGWW